MQPSSVKLPGRPARAAGGAIPVSNRWTMRLVTAHLAILIIGASWGFGGMSANARLAVAGWATLGIGLAAYLAVRQRSWRRILSHLWPLLAFDVLVGASALNPNVDLVRWESETLLQATEPHFAWLPSSVRASAALEQLWVLNAIVFSCYNVLAIARRKSLRILVAIVAGNALLLAILGTIQKLTGAKGIFFGAVETPQKYFFSTFVYHNHWGAFTLLSAAGCVGLLFHVLRRGRERDIWHSPALAGAVAIVLLAATVPLSGSRSSSVLLALFVFGALLHFLGQLVRRRREALRSAVAPVFAIVVVAIVATASIGWLARDVIQRRTETTIAQFEQLRATEGAIPRMVLYRDTWRTAQEKRWFGWGLASYPDVFQIFNSQRAQELWFGQPYYRDAHSDWLQSLVETGFIGTALALALGIAPLWTAVRHGFFTALPTYLLVGCGLVLVYAFVEFPFANLAVIIVFWLSLYIAVRYTLIEREARAEESISHG